MTIDFIEADSEDLDADGDTTEVPSFSWTLLSSPVLADLNNCE